MMATRHMPSAAGMRTAPARFATRSGSASRRKTLQVNRAGITFSPESNNVEGAKIVESEGGQCNLFIEADGNIIQAMCCDYGFRSGAGRLYEEHYGEIPQSVWTVGIANFRHEFDEMRRYTRRAKAGAPKSETELEKSSPLAKALLTANRTSRDAFGNLDAWLEGKGVLGPLPRFETDNAPESEECVEIRDKLSRLVLSNDAVARREHSREQRDGVLKSPTWVKVPFLALCWVLDVFYDHKPIQKFWVLEVVARIPYFACISILHLYETVGFWRAGAEIRKVHFAEEWNELHHLQIMETLGGDQSWLDRVIAEHAALLYYWMLIAFYLINPRIAYNFMQRVELHAYDTYAEFVEENKELLKTIPPPMVALNYYRNQDLFMFDAFQKAQKDWTPRRPPCDNLFDTFTNIRDDEFEHVKTMIACQDDSIARDLALQRGAPQQSNMPRRN